jgi:hypothetical protein
MIREATKTRLALLCRLEKSGHVTLFLSSSIEPIIKSVSFTIVINCHSLHGWRDSNSQPMVLETTTLPIELHPYTVKRTAKLVKFK